MKPFEVNMDRVKVTGFGGNFGSTTSYLIPTVRLRVSALGSVWAKSGGAKAHGKYYVDGLEKAMMQELAKKLQDDLVAKMRAAGYTVLTYDDVKSEPDVTGQSLDKIDSRYGLPTSGGLGTPVTFVDATPTDAQAFTKAIQGPVWPFRGLAKAKDFTVIIPEIRFTTPQMWGQAETSAFMDKAGISSNPAMILEEAMVYGVTPKGGGPTIQIYRHGKRTAADVTGTITKVGEDNTHVSHTLDWSSGDFVMTLDRTAFTDGVLRVGFALNDLITKEIVKEHR